MLTRRLALLSGISLAACGPANTGSAETVTAGTSANDDDIDWANLTEAQWRERLTPAQFNVLRREGTERPGSSPLNEETREGIYACAGCALPLFSSETKYESGTGWPSFWQPLDDALDTKTDYRIWTPRTEYHCTRCGGHQGHVFDDGPQPTGQRWCNNGVALQFIPANGA
ncbi:MAG: peptide-methionine (R)-S-oxide reductase [Oceanicaulis sp. HLUCCA04]|nr:MAG: peptide-methionine (R)-S-oxide reductase [Oceanicaulis sp. HLUCCA04]